MDPPSVFTLVILAGVLLLLFTEWVPPGVTGLLAIVALVVSGVLSSASAFAGFTNGAVITVGCMYVLSAGITRTGAAALLANKIAARADRHPHRTYVALLLVAMVMSAFVNNTPLVLVFLPLVLGLAAHLGEPPSRLLIPLSFVSILGGMCTLIGTSTNLIVASSLADVSGGAYQLEMFDFARVGVPIAIACAFLMLVLRRFLLPDRPSLGASTTPGVGVEYLTEIEAGPQSPLIGRTIAEIEADDLLGAPLRILEVVRGEVIQVPRPELEIRTGDLFLVKGGPEAVFEVRLGDSQHGTRNLRELALSLFEVLVTPGSPWIGRRVGELALHDRYGASVFALQRHGAHLRVQIDTVRLSAGDVLLVQGTDATREKLRANEGVLVVEGVEEIVRDTRRAPVALAGLGLFVCGAISGLVPIEIAALSAALLLVVSGILNARSAYDAVGWDVLFLVAGTLALGRAFEETGLARTGAHGIVSLAAPYGLHATLGVLLVLATLLTQVLSNNATAAIMTPLAYELGLSFGDSGPLPFVLAVAFGANCCFMTPVSYNTNLLVYGPGGYRFGDFVRPGLPLTLVFLVMAVVLLPLLH